MEEEENRAGAILLFAVLVLWDVLGRRDPALRSGCRALMMRARQVVRHATGCTRGAPYRVTTPAAQPKRASGGSATAAAGGARGGQCGATGMRFRKGVWVKDSRNLLCLLFGLR